MLELEFLLSSLVPSLLFSAPVFPLLLSVPVCPPLLEPVPLALESEFLPRLLALELRPVLELEFLLSSLVPSLLFSAPVFPLLLSVLECLPLLELELAHLRDLTEVVLIFPVQQLVA